MKQIKKLEKRYIGRFVKITSNKLKTVINDKNFALISTYDNNKNKKLLNEILKTIQIQNISIYPIAIYLENKDIKLDMWLIVNDNLDEKIFFEKIKNFIKNFNQNYFIFKEKYLAVYDEENLIFQCNELNEKNFTKCIKQLFLFENLFNKKDLKTINSYFLIPKDNIFGKRVFKNNYLEVGLDNIRKIIE
jgi:hypothetical protein